MTESYSELENRFQPNTDSPELKTSESNPEKLPLQPQAPKERTPQLSDDLAPIEREEKEKVRQEATLALKKIHELLQGTKELTKNQIITAIDQTMLKQLMPVYKRQLVSAIEGQDVQSKDPKEFIEKGLKVLDLWIHLQGMKRGTDIELQTVRNNIKKM